MTWNPTAIPEQTGRRILITGASAGIGYFAAEQLAHAGAHVILASRTPRKLTAAEDSIRRQVPGASVETVSVDMTSLESVAHASQILSRQPHVDGVLLNAGVMLAKRRSRTVDGIPTMIASHVVGNFALMAHLLPKLAESGNSEAHSRIVHTSTGFVRRFRFDVSDLTRTFWPSVASYTHAKTVNEIFAYELDRRLRSERAPIKSLLSHPGVGVDAKTPFREGVRDATTAYQRNPYTPWAQGKDAAAWSAVRAMTDPSAEGSDFFAPAGGLRGTPARIPALARTATPPASVSSSVWRQLEQLTSLSLLLLRV